MNQIDDALRLIGSAPPPDGLERRVNARLDDRLGAHPDAHPIGRFPTVGFISAMAIAASIAVGAVALIPGVKEFTLHDTPAYSGIPRTIAHPSGAFGGASAAHIPAAPVPVQPTPVSQGRGHSRSAQMALPSAERKPLPRGVALPHELQARVPVSTATTAISAQR